MGRENATAFHPHCVIYNISDTTTPKFALRASQEKNAIPHRRVKRKNNNSKDIPFTTRPTSRPVCDLQMSRQLLSGCEM